VPSHDTAINRVRKLRMMLTTVCFVAWRQQRTMTTYDDGDAQERTTKRDVDLKRWRDAWEWRAKTIYDNVERRRRETTTYDDDDARRRIYDDTLQDTTKKRDDDETKRRWRSDARRETWQKRTTTTYNDVTTNDNGRTTNISTAGICYCKANKNHICQLTYLANLWF